LQQEGLAEKEGAKSEERVSHANEYYEYELVGVLVHSGDADGGHYYSYIKVSGLFFETNSFSRNLSVFTFYRREVNKGT